MLVHGCLWLLELCAKVIRDVHIAQAPWPKAPGPGESRTVEMTGAGRKKISCGHKKISSKSSFVRNDATKHSGALATVWPALTSLSTSLSD